MTFFVVSGGKMQMLFNYSKEILINPLGGVSVPPAMEKQVLLSRRYRIELLLSVFFLLPPVLFQA